MQLHIFRASKKYRETAKPRYSKNIGLGIKTPKTASEGIYIHRKCPFRFAGISCPICCVDTIIVRGDCLDWTAKYKRFEKCHNKIPAHLSPAFVVKEGDI
jgi:small subunit ribosomal protein S11e